MGHKIHSAAAIALANHPSLKELDLTFNPIEKEGRQALENNKRFIRLRYSAYA